MSCFVKLSYINENISKQGGIDIPASIVMNTVDYEKMKNEFIGDKKVKITRLMDKDIIHQCFYPDMTFNDSFLDSLSKIDHEKAFEKMKEIAYLVDKYSETIFHKMVDEYEFKLSMDELEEITNSQGYDSQTLAHRMALNGHIFTVDEILRLGNPINKYGTTVAHSMAYKGHIFTVEDILKLGNPTNYNGKSIGDFMMEHNNRNAFTDEEKKLLGISD